MTKYRVHFEASAAIGVEVEVEASSEEEAEQIAQKTFGEGRIPKFETLVDELLKPDPIAVEAYAEATRLPVTYTTIELDENGFDLVDTFSKELVT